MLISFSVPACHEDSFVSSKLLSVDQNSDICKYVSAAQPVQVEQDVARMACELDAAVCCTRHFVEICNKTQSNESHCPMHYAHYLLESERRLWEVGLAIPHHDHKRFD